ncbi:MAG: ATP-binding protein [Calditrichota bacterium]
MSDTSPQPHDSGQDVESLVSAFRYFNETATTLSAAYQRLEFRVEQLTRELEEKDQMLYSRLREMDRLNRYFSSLLESLSSGVIAIDLEGRITIFNGTAAAYTDQSAENAIGKDYEEVMGSDSTSHNALFTLYQGIEIHQVEKNLPGSNRKVIVSTTWVVDSLGERVGVLELLDDVSVLRRMEERFEHQKTLSALGEMAAAVAHELRNPLAGIAGFTALLRDDLKSQPDKLRLVDKVMEGVKTLERLAGNLLFLAKPIDIKLETLDIHNLITDIVDLLRSETIADRPQLRLEAFLPEEKVNVVGNTDLIRMAILNLGRNALQAVKDDGLVSFYLTWKLMHNRVEIIVEDNGCGIKEEHYNRLFSPFFSTKERGTGLGLALVKKAVELHKGEIGFETEIGKGSKFIITLPIRLQEAQRRLDLNPPRDNDENNPPS